MGKECVHTAIDVPRPNRRSKCGYFSPCKQGRGLARNGVQALECINKDLLNRTQRHPGTESTLGGGRGSGRSSSGPPLKDVRGGKRERRNMEGTESPAKGRLAKGILEMQKHLIPFVQDQKRYMGLFVGARGQGATSIPGLSARTSSWRTRL